MNKRLSRIIILAVLVFFTVNAANRPKLVILISVDQMRADYLQRFKKEFSGGFKLITEQGTVYRNASLNYAPSETGPGHATISTGCYPWKTGILANDWYDPSTRKDVYCVGDTSAEKVQDEGGGASPRNLEVSALGDWLKQESPHSRVVAVSLKDRAAVLLGGQHPDLVFWYNRKSGDMVTSDYYTGSIPAWVKSFNTLDWVDRNVPAAWTRLRPDDVYENYGPDSVVGERLWNGSSTFPHVFSSDKRKEQILTSPYGDLMTLDFARTILRYERLGQGESVDLLCISLSCTDYIGHAFGPNSQEMADQMFRLDLSIGSFLSDAERLVGHGKILVALSADHGVLPLPEYTVNIDHRTARRIVLQEAINPNIVALDRSLEKKFGTSEHIIQSKAFLNYRAAAQGGIDSVELERQVKEGLMKIDGVADVYFRRELLDVATPERPYLDALRHGYYPPRGEDFLLRFCENCLVTGSTTGTSHGTPYSYDTHVPLVFWGTGVRPATVDRSVYTVDLAPTLAALLGLRSPAGVDGQPLTEMAN